MEVHCQQWLDEFKKKPDPQAKHDKPLEQYSQPGNYTEQIWHEDELRKYIELHYKQLSCELHIEQPGVHNEHW